MYVKNFFFNIRDKEKDEKVRKHSIIITTLKISMIEIFNLTCRLLLRRDTPKEKYFFFQRNEKGLKRFAIIFSLWFLCNSKL